MLNNEKNFKVVCTYSCWGKILVCLDIPNRLSTNDIKNMVLGYAAKSKRDLESPYHPEYINDNFNIDIEGEVEEC